MTNVGIVGVAEDDRGAGGFADGRVEQIKRVGRELSPSGQGNFGSLPGRDRADVLRPGCARSVEA
jgi:hypothetical protein